MSYIHECDAFIAAVERIVLSGGSRLVLLGGCIDSIKQKRLHPVAYTRPAGGTPSIRKK